MDAEPEMARNVGLEKLVDQVRPMDATYMSTGRRGLPVSGVRQVCGKKPCPVAQENGYDGA